MPRFDFKHCFPDRRRIASGIRQWLPRTKSDNHQILQFPYSSGEIVMRPPTIGFLLSRVGLGSLLLPLTGCRSVDLVSENSALYVSADDATPLAMDVWLPLWRLPGTKLPTVLKLTRYWRNIDERSLGDLAATRGYAFVTVDVRGTGASFGVSRSPWSPEEVQDYRTVIDWIVSQPW